MPIYPILLSSLLADTVQFGAAKTHSQNALGDWCLVGHLPSEVSLPNKSTRVGVLLPTAALAAEGFSLDMACWPLKRGLLSFGKANFDIGRSPKSDLVWPHASISKDHARLTIDGDELFIEERGSANGTRVGETFVKERTVVPDGSVLQLGDMIVTAMKTGRLLGILGG